MFAPASRKVRGTDRNSVVITVLISLAAFPGCQKQSSVSGKVYYQDRNVLSGSVQVLGPDGILRVTGIVDGGYSFSELTPGPLKIAVTSPDPGTIQGPSPENLKKRKLDNIPRISIDRSKWFPLPDKYRSVDSSGIILDLKPGLNSLDIRLD